MDELILKVQKLVESASTILITAHKNPDSDAVGSSLSWAKFLRKLGKRVEVALPNAYPSFLHWMNGVEDIYIFEKDPVNTGKIVDEADLIFILDLNSLSRLDELGKRIEGSDSPRVMIDHHLDPKLDQFSLVFSDTKVSSTCEYLFEIMTKWNAKLIDAEIGTLLYSGILADTGTFSYATSPRLFRNVASLLEISGIPHIDIQYRQNNNHSEKSVRLLGYCLSERMEVLPDLGVGIIHLDREDFKSWNIQRGDTEGIVNHILRIEGIDIAAFFTDQSNVVKLSLRSAGDFSVAQVASDHFSGGGHRNAAGGHSFKSLNETIKTFKRVLPSYQKN